MSRSRWFERTYKRNDDLRVPCHHFSRASENPLPMYKLRNAMQTFESAVELDLISRVEVKDGPTRQDPPLDPNA